MGIQPAGATVRIVLPNDTVLRAPIVAETTAGDLISLIKPQDCDDAEPTEPTRTQTVRLGRSFELVLVRNGHVLQEKQFMKSAGVRDGDILEWYAGKDHSVVTELESHVSEHNNHQNEKAEQTGRSENGDDQQDRTNQPDARTGRQNRGRQVYHQQRGRQSVVLHRRSLRVSQVPRQKVRFRSPRQASTLSRGHAPLSRLMPRDVALRVGFECLDRLASLQSRCRQLVLQVRDIKSRQGPQPFERVFPVIHALAHETTELMRRDSLVVGDAPSRSVRWLYPLIARSIHGTELPVIIEGYVDVAEWVALWRNQRRVYACLCDGAKLMFFTSQKQCEEFIFEQVTRGNRTTQLDSVEEADHRRIMKENAPHTTIDLRANKWKVRKGETPNLEDDSEATPRHAFAFFDGQGKLRLILDVTSQAEANQWIAAIKNEIRQTEVLAVKLVPANDGVSSPANRSRMHNLKVPLRWLHSHVDSISRGHARVERAKSWTLTQALKDLQRDRLQINSIVYNGLCVEEIVGTLLMETTRLAPELTPSEALAFIRLLIVTSSRTQGGGDILDAMRVVVGPTADSAQHYFCPVEATCMEPICIDIGLGRSDDKTSSGGEYVVIATIQMQMSYRVLANTDDGALEEDGPLSDASNELILKGVYRRELRCCAEDWNRLDGNVAITVEEILRSK